MNILITGGASGLGESVTRKLAASKTGKVYFSYNRSAEKARTIESEYGNAVGLKCDFTDRGDVERFISQINLLDLDVLINNAYIDTPFAHFHKIASADFLLSFKENILPVIEITQAAITGFRKRKQGRIISVLTSYLLDVPPAGSSIYVANKSYLAKLTKVWASENVKFNITSNSVSPSFMQTPLTAGVDERLIEQKTGNHPLKRLLTVEEVADTVAFLVNASPHINGVDIVMNAAANIK
jgi:NAD(P)-dependent dehydrogenase (short-subunit alcohol dehydrogenase family)